MLILGNPEKSFPRVIHVAGTNGKGSIIAFMQSILAASGLRVNRYTSPHLICFTERITLNGQSISQEKLCKYLHEVKIANNHNPLSLFEALTAAAFLAFVDYSADVILLETGIGGRLDVTNIIPAPAVCVISSLSYDHQEYLGKSIEEIAIEKAGIIKRGSRVVIAVQDHPHLIDQIIDPRCRQMEATREPLRGISQEVLGLQGIYQNQNAQAAVTAVYALLGEVDPSTVIKGLAQARWPGRMEQMSLDPEIWLEGAHNEGGLRQLSLQIEAWQDDRPVHVYLAMASNRDLLIVIEALADCLAKRNTRVYAVDMTEELVNNVLGTQQFHCAEKFVTLFSERGIACEKVPLTLIFDKINQNKKDFPRNLITGSLYLVGKMKTIQPMGYGYT